MALGMPGILSEFLVVRLRHLFGLGTTWAVTIL
jgi:hypothetical protein